MSAHLAAFKENNRKFVILPYLMIGAHQLQIWLSFSGSILALFYSSPQWHLQRYTNSLSGLMVIELDHYLLLCHGKCHLLSTWLLYGKPL